MSAKQSAVQFEAAPAAMTTINGWDIVETFGPGEKGTALVDLSHCPCMDIQAKNLDAFKDLPDGLTIPGQINGIHRNGPVFISRMNPTQCMVLGLDGNLPEFSTPNATDISGGHTLLGLVGKDTARILEALAPLDLFTPDAYGMALCQAPVLNIPCQLLVLDREQQTVILAFARGYGQDMARAILSAGKIVNLVPGGFRAITQWLENLGDAS